MTRVAISAHRGGGEDAPAASWAAYVKSVETGADYVEFDIRRTADDVFVCYHDDLGGRTYAELCAYAGQEVPRAFDVMELIAGRAMGHLDLKEVGDERRIIRAALDILGETGFVATSLEDVSIAAVRAYAPQVRTALSLGRDLAGVPVWQQARVRRSELYPLPRLRACGAQWVSVHHRLALGNVLRVCRRAGIGAMVWTVNEERLMSRLLADPRVSVLITDRPRRAVTLRA